MTTPANFFDFPLDKSEKMGYTIQALVRNRQVNSEVSGCSSVLVEYLNGVQGAAGSSPVTQTKK